MLGATLQAEIEARLGSALGAPFVVREVDPQAGGSISEALRLSDGKLSVFVKLRPASDRAMFEAECDGLQALARCAAFRVPRPLAVGADGERAFLAMEWLALRPVRERDEGERLGRALAELHALEAERYGWPRDNYIGASPQANPLHDNWARFFVEQRLRPQFARAAARGFAGSLAANGERVCERAAALFLDYRPRPTLVHGDLWHGNVGVLDTGEPVLFDPACYWGDRETDLAMSELFGGLPLSFYAAYRLAAPLHDGFEPRKLLYNLYHVLNHLNLFGRGYLNQAERMAARLAAELSR